MLQYDIIKARLIEMSEGETHLGMIKLFDWLENQTDWLQAPASTRFHGAYKGGLIIHSQNVANKLNELTILNKLEWQNPRSPMLVGLLHDICKVNFYEVEKRNRKNKETGQWEEYDFYIHNEKFPMGHGDKSVILLQNFIKLTPEEMLCIRWHMGAYSGEKDWTAIGKAQEININVLWTHVADVLATREED